MNSVQQSDVSDREALAQLRVADAACRASRSAAGSVWFPLLAGGVATLAAPTAIDLIGGDAAASYWMAAGPAVGILCAVFYASRPIQLAARRGVVSVCVAAAIVIGAMVLGAMGSGSWTAGGPVLVVAVGLGVFAWLTRARRSWARWRLRTSWWGSC